MESNRPRVDTYSGWQRSNGCRRARKRSDTNARTKAAELLGKRYMMWTDKQQIETTATVQFNDDID